MSRSFTSLTLFDTDGAISSAARDIIGLEPVTYQPDLARCGRVDVILSGLPPRDRDPVAAIRDRRPRLFVLENVRGLAAPRQQEQLHTLLGELQAPGYVVGFRVLDPADYRGTGCRKRLYIVGIRDDLSVDVRWPKKRRREPGTGGDARLLTAALVAVNMPLISRG